MSPNNNKVIAIYNDNPNVKHTDSQVGIFNAFASGKDIKKLTSIENGSISFSSHRTFLIPNFATFYVR